MILRNYQEPNNDWQIITMPSLLAGRRYRFVWLDCCHTAGSNKIGIPRDGFIIHGEPNGSYMTANPQTQFRWIQAFNINMSIFEGAFMSTNGLMFFESPVPNSFGLAWGQWRRFFWDSISARQSSVLEAITWANLRLPAGAREPNPRSISPTLRVPKLVVQGEYKW